MRPPIACALAMQGLLAACLAACLAARQCWGPVALVRHCRSAGRAVWYGAPVWPGSLTGAIGTQQGRCAFCVRATHAARGGRLGMHGPCGDVARERGRLARAQVLKFGGKRSAKPGDFIGVAARTAAHPFDVVFHRGRLSCPCTPARRRAPRRGGPCKCRCQLCSCRVGVSRTPAAARRLARTAPGPLQFARSVQAVCARVSCTRIICRSVRPDCADAWRAPAARECWRLRPLHHGL